MQIKQTTAGIITLAAAALGAYIIFAGSTYYVSPTGSDANACTQSAPCKTIKRGIAVAQNGDTVQVAQGTYREYVTINKSIALVSSGAIIDGTGGTIQDGVVSVTASGARLEGFFVANAIDYGLAVFGNDNEIIGNVIHDTRDAGIWMRDGQRNTFEGNEVYYTVLQNSVSFDGIYYTCNPNSTGWASAINSWGAAGYNTWRGNFIHDNCGEGIVARSFDVIENNTLRNNWSVEIYIDGFSNVTVRNNTITNSKPYIVRGSSGAWRAIPAGIAIADELTPCGSDNNIITGNAITAVRYGLSFYQIQTCSGIKNTVFENNAITNATDYGLRIGAGNHTNTVIRNNTIRLTTGKPLTIQTTAISVTGNLFYSGANVFEWNGKTYNFTTWRAIVPGNGWDSAVTPAPVTPTFTATRTATATATRTATTTNTPAPITTTITPACYPVSVGGDYIGDFCQ